MSMDEESARLGRSVKLVCGTFLLFLVAGFQSCSEIDYKLFGKQADAKIQQVTSTSAGFRSGPGQDVRYLFTTADGSGHSGGMQVSPDLQRPDDNTLKITYLPSDPDHSIATEKRSNIWFVIFLIILAGFVALCVGVWQQAKQDVQKSKRR
jgi:hypothetical protein